jgi:hypothetical protein
MMAAAWPLLDVLVAWQWAVVGYFEVVNTFYLALLGAAVPTMRRHSHLVWEDIPWRRARALLTLRYLNRETELGHAGGPLPGSTTPSSRAVSADIV